VQERVFSANARKTLAVIFVISLFLFIKYRPYDQSSLIATSTYQQIFFLYFFITNQTLGIIHEAGHGVCYILPCPEFFMVLNGTLFQLFLPLGIGYYYKRRKLIFPWLIALFFTGLSLQYTAWYISTAQQGAYISAANSFLGVDAIHDFNYILSHLHILKYNSQIAFILKLFSYLLMIFVVIKMVFIAFVFDSKR
jgi:hypothetical protein